MKQKILILPIILFFINIASASYISGDIYIYETGTARFNVESDVPLNLENLNFANKKVTGTTDALTSKTSGTWTFMLNFNKYDNILLDIHLPRNLNTITSIEGVNSILDIEDRVISLIDSGELTFTTSYTLKNSTNYNWIFWPVLFVIISVAYILIKQSRKRKNHLKHILPLINEQEQKIIDFLMKCPKRQKEMRKALNIPKASFSRYITNLEKKKLIMREGEGKNKILKLK